MMNRLSRIAASCGIVILTGCVSSHPLPVVQMRLTGEALERSSRVIDDQESPLWRQAQNKFADAETTLAQGEYKKARMLAEQAELDARLAEAQALLERSENQLQTLNRQIETLKTELQEYD